MKRIIHKVSNGHITVSVYDDDNNLIIGNYMQSIPANADPEQFVVDRVYPIIETIITPEPEPETIQIDASPILQAVEIAKETIKWQAIQHIKTNPDVSLTDFTAHVDQTYGWSEAGLIMKLLHEYVIQAEKKQMIPALESNTKEYFFAVLKQIVINSTDEQLTEALK